MAQRVSKVDAAVNQLNWAIKLFLDEKAYVPAITLAGATENILGGAVKSKSAYNELMDKFSTQLKIDKRDKKRIQLLSFELNSIKNWLKHWENMKDSEYLEEDLETAAIQFIVRAIINLMAHVGGITSETSRFFEWVSKNRKDLGDDVEHIAKMTNIIKER